MGYFHRLPRRQRGRVKIVTGASSRDSKPSWLLSLIALIGLGVLFYSSYGLSNWLASRRGDVPSVVFGWEHHIPFLAWTIIPYWTTNLFYAASLFLCESKRELGIHVKRLVAVQVIAVTCFIVFPLKFSWPKPATSGFSGQLFDQLASFDMPYNQAPSLHVALTIILASFFLTRIPHYLKLPFIGWSVLVIVSTLTTYQHHFIDLPTGALLGFLIVWALPYRGVSPLAQCRLTRQSDRRRLAIYYVTGAAVLIALAAIGGGWLWLLWPAVSLALVSLGYLLLGPAVFTKSADGKIGVAARVLFAPYLLGAYINSRIWTRNDPEPVEVMPGLWLGRFPSSADIGKFGHVIDLTSEFSRPDSANGANWQSIPMLDLVAPDPALLRSAAQQIGHISANSTILVCCALGYGRSVAVIAVWMILQGHAKSIQSAVELLRRVRPKLAVTPAQLSAMGSAIDD